MTLTARQVQDRKAERQRQATAMAVQRQEANMALATNTCPACGRGVRTNLAITGWVQCEQFGSIGFRKDDNAPSCSWQGFTQ